MARSTRSRRSSAPSSKAMCACIAFPHDYTADNDTSTAQAVIGSLDELTVEYRGGDDAR